VCCCPLAPHSAWTVPPSCPCLRDTPTVDRCPVRRLHPVHRRCLRPSRRVLHRLPCRRRRHQFRRHCRPRRLLCRRFPRRSLLRPHFFRHRLCLRRRCVELSTDIARACCSHRLRGGTLSILYTRGSFAGWCAWFNGSRQHPVGWRTYGYLTTRSAQAQWTCTITGRHIPRARLHGLLAHIREVDH
jgi:hypothetical protein